MKNQIKTFVCSVLVAVAWISLVPAEAVAEWHGFHHSREPEWHHGHWAHDRHDGRLGWWWIVGSSWHYYERPAYFVQPRTVVIQQAPSVVYQPPIEQAPVVVAQAPMATPVLYYCKATGTNYPETMSCPGGWTTMTAETPPQP